MEVRLDKWLPDTIIMHLNGAIIIITGVKVNLGYLPLRCEVVGPRHI